MSLNNTVSDQFRFYSSSLSDVLKHMDWTNAELLAKDLLNCWQSGRQVFLAGNGGSAGNANHIANDFLYPISKQFGSGIKIHSLSVNPAILSCLANDLGYEHVFSGQLSVLANSGDILVVLSGSGNSINIVNALYEARRIGVKSYAIVGFDGGRAKNNADIPIHFPINDMQIAEDTQTILFHMIVQWLYPQRNSIVHSHGHEE